MKTYVASLQALAECEITGVTMTPDHKAIFINVQHPGEALRATMHQPATGLQAKPIVQIKLRVHAQELW